MKAFLYSGGSMKDLGTPGGMGSYASGINDSGQVVGTEGGQAFLYNKGSVQNLGTFGGAKSDACGINSNGQVVGDAWTSGGYDHAFLYSGGSIQDLGTLPSGTDSSAAAINNLGQIVGTADTGGGYGHAFLYSGGSMQDLGTLLAGRQSEALGINNSGQVVGYAYAGEDVYGDPISHAFLYNGSGPIEDLNSLIIATSGWTLEEATGINDSGQICGYGIDPSGNTDAFLLTPIPEPSTFVLLAAGAVGLLGYAWRRCAKT